MNNAAIRKGTEVRVNFFGTIHTATIVCHFSPTLYGVRLDNGQLQQVDASDIRS